MHLQVPHKFSQKQAVDRVTEGLTAARPQLAGQVTIDEERWEGNTLHFAFTAQGHKITGTLLVTDKEYLVDAKLPLVWRLFEKKIERTIQDQVATMLK